MKKLLAVVLALGLVWIIGCSNETTNPSEYDLSFSKGIQFDLVRKDVIEAPAAEVDSYWIDSWTADGEGTSWYTPELYTFTKGDVVECVVFFVQTEEYNQFVRYDGFYFCGSKNPLKYLAYGWGDFGTIPPNEPNYGWITGLGYDTATVPNVILGKYMDFASKCIVKTTPPKSWFAAGVPLAGRPDCFVIN
jgi:hypothetical protein